nr:MAG TPA: hypothetical protein [Caudoviricetes sp.]
MSLSGADKGIASRNTAGCFLVPGFKKKTHVQGVSLNK